MRATRGRPHREIAACAMLACCSLLLVGCAADGPGPTTAPPVSSSAAVSAPPVTSRLPTPVTSDPVQGRPIGVVGVDGQAWYALSGDGAVARPGGTTAVGRIPLRLAAAPEGAWVSVFGDGAVVLVGRDGQIIRQIELPMGAEPEGLVLDGDILWVVDQADDALLSFDAKTGRRLGRVDVGTAPRLAALGAEDVWVTTYGTGAVTGVGRRDRKLRVNRPEICRGVQGVAEARGVVWVSCTLDDVVVGLDRTSLTEVARVPLDDADAVTTDGRRVFAIGQSGPTLAVIDAQRQGLLYTQTLDDASAVGDGNVDAAVVGGDLVVTHPDAERVYRVDLSP